MVWGGGGVKSVEEESGGLTEKILETIEQERFFRFVSSFEKT